MINKRRFAQSPHGLALVIVGLLSSSTSHAGSAETDESEANKPEVATFAAAHILISYKAAKRSLANVARNKLQALTLARKVAAMAQQTPKTFADLARRYSDGPTASRGGDLRSFRAGQMVQPFERALRRLPIGGISGPVETVFGYHIILRKAPPEMLAGAHILIVYKGASRARSTITRSKNEALALAKKVLAMANKAPKRFSALARQYSDGPSAAKGGKLGKWPKGRMVPAFGAAMSRLAVGAIGGPVETPFGFHLLRRDDPNKTP
ncbi:MAG: peptidylprolyl isomerase [Deltaproteobacteria bacterium]|nr:peptidylprolyl isomerase [Deltaproteobacteria bacterium]